MMGTAGQIDRHLRAIVGDGHVLPREALSTRPSGYGDHNLSADWLVRPADTAEIAACLRLCDAEGWKIATHGGLTGLVDGAMSRAGYVILSTERMAAIDPVDIGQRQMTTGAGAKLEAVHEAAHGAGFRFGVDLGARGSCTIGGMIATNAGGNRVLRYGMTRHNVAGLEAVLADGTILSDLGGLAKNNAGYDLKSLFIGSEGTLGVITRARLTLYSAPTSSATALLAFDTFDAAFEAMQQLRATLGALISAVEAMWPAYFEVVSRHILGNRPPIIATNWPIYLLVQIECDAPANAMERLTDTIGALDRLGDGTIAQNERQEATLWAIRDASEAVEKPHAAAWSFDVSIRADAFADYHDLVQDALQQALPHSTLYSFGHLADGNIHFVVGVDTPDPDTKRAVETCVYEPLMQFNPASISAEHGIGVEKAPHLWRTRSDAEIETMNRIRDALDPNRTLNPHIVFSRRSEQQM